MMMPLTVITATALLGREQPPVGGLAAVSQLELYASLGHVLHFG
jgi:hypothetical protein